MEIEIEEETNPFQKADCMTDSPASTCPYCGSKHRKMPWPCFRSAEDDNRFLNITNGVGWKEGDAERVRNTWLAMKMYCLYHFSEPKPFSDGW